MNIKIADLMAKQVITSQPHHTIDHVRKIMQRNHISAVPIVNPDNEPLGIVTSSDLGKGLKGNTPVSSILQPHVYQVPAYNDISVAAKVMIKNHIHHLVVTHEGSIVGIISSFDLLHLIDKHRFTMNNPPEEGRKSKRNLK
ncbi:MAG: CBS domain-containing protein [Saprospiraceae bacterium]|nr:CBS domain-containing protein [Saprospiraceae bacterium]